MNYLLFIIETLLIIGIGKFLLDKTTLNFDDDKAIKEGNQAVKIRRQGALIGVVVASLSALIWTHSGDLWDDALWIFIYGLLAIALTLAGMKISDWMLSSGFQNEQFIKQNNQAVAIVEASGAIGSALVAFGAVACDGSFLSAIIYWVMGILILNLMLFIFKKTQSMNFASEIEGAQNKLAARYYGAHTIAFALIILGAIFGPSDEDGNFATIARSMVSAAIAFAALLVVNFILQKVLLGGQRLDQTLKFQDGKINIINGVVVALALLISYIYISY